MLRLLRSDRLGARKTGHAWRFGERKACKLSIGMTRDYERPAGARHLDMVILLLEYSSIYFAIVHTIYSAIWRYFCAIHCYLFCQFCFRPFVFHISKNREQVMDLVFGKLRHQ